MFKKYCVSHGYLLFSFPQFLIFDVKKDNSCMKEHFSFPPKNVRKYYFKEFSLRNKVKKEKIPFTHFPHLSIENNNIFYLRN